MTQKQLGLIVNPVAGLGGSVALKGSDGVDTQAKALSLGARPRAQDRARHALERIVPIREDVALIAYPHDMGEDAARSCGFEPQIIGSIRQGKTTPEDTRRAAQEMLERKVDLLLFAGGDGTARDIYQAIGLQLPALGIPAGVKIHSAVYATHPGAAGELARLYLQGRVSSLREAEVMDVDEDAFRQGLVSARLYGYLKIPFRTSLVQNLKMASVGGEAAVAPLARDVVEGMEDGCLYIIGPGTTTRAISDELGIAKTLLGVDVVLNRKLLATDVSESQILRLLDEHRDSTAKIVVTPIGGQGYIFGRGNQQISPGVIERIGRENVVVVSTREKLYSLGSQPLRVDTGDPVVDDHLNGYLIVVTGYRERAVRKVAI